MAHFALGYTLYDLGRFHEAYRHLRYYAELAPAGSWNWCWYGKAAQAIGEIDEARAAYRRAIELERATTRRPTPPSCWPSSRAAAEQQPVPPCSVGSEAAAGAESVPPVVYVTQIALDTHLMKLHHPIRTAMNKRTSLILDTTLLDAAEGILGTRGPTATVREALSQTVRQADLERLAEWELPEDFPQRLEEIRSRARRAGIRCRATSRTRAPGPRPGATAHRRDFASSSTGCCSPVGSPRAATGQELLQHQQRRRVQGAPRRPRCPGNAGADRNWRLGVGARSGAGGEGGAHRLIRLHADRAVVGARRRPISLTTPTSTASPASPGSAVSGLPRAVALVGVTAAAPRPAAPRARR